MDRSSSLHTDPLLNKQVKDGATSGDGGRAKGCRTSQRHLVVLMCTLGFLLGLGTWSSFSLVLTHVTSGSDMSSFQATSASVNASSVPTYESNPLPLDCSVVNTSRDLRVSMAEDQVFFLQTTYTAAMTAFKLPGGILSTRFSPKRVTGLAMAAMCGVLVTIPWALTADFHWLLFLLLFLQGIAYSCLVPTFVYLVSSWSVDAERSGFLAVMYSGAYLGPAMSVVMTGACLCYVHWSSALYITGLAGFLWMLVWMKWVYDSPSLHPRLSLADRRHFGHLEVTSGSSKRLMKSIPWRSILTSLPVWALFLAVFSRDYMLVIYAVAMPQYYSDVYRMNPAYIGLCSILPPVGTGLVIFVGGLLSNFLLRRGLARTVVRKVLVCLGTGTQGLSLLGLYYVNSWPTAVFFFSISSLGGLATAGYPPMFHDMSPDYTPVLAGFAQYGFCGAIVATLLAAFEPGQSRTLSTWQELFLITAVIQITIAFLFAVMADSNRQSWGGCDVIDTSSPRDAEEKMTSEERKRRSDVKKVESLVDYDYDVLSSGLVDLRDDALQPWANLYLAECTEVAVDFPVRRYGATE